MDVAKFRKFAELHKLKSSKEDEVKAIKKELDELEKQLLEEFQEEGVGDIGVNNGERKVKLYLKRDVRAHSLMGQDATAEACEKAGLGDIVHKRVNANTLSAFVRERMANGEELPPEFEGVIAPFEQFSVGVRAS